MSFTAQKDVEEEKISIVRMNNSSHLIKIPVILEFINFLNISKEVKNLFAKSCEKNILNFSKSIIQNKKTIF